jgi:hypothetical protein
MILVDWKAWCIFKTHYFSRNYICWWVVKAWGSGAEVNWHPSRHSPSRADLALTDDPPTAHLPLRQCWVRVWEIKGARPWLCSHIKNDIHCSGPGGQTQLVKLWPMFCFMRKILVSWLVRFFPMKAGKCRLQKGDGCLEICHFLKCILWIPGS